MGDKGKDKHERHKERRKYDTTGSISIGSEKKPGRGGKISLFTVFAAAGGVLMIVAFAMPLLRMDGLALIDKFHHLSDKQWEVEELDRQIQANPDGQGANHKSQRRDKLRAEIQEEAAAVRDQLAGEAGTIAQDALSKVGGRIDVAAIDEEATYDDWFVLSFGLILVETDRDELAKLSTEDKQTLLCGMYDLVEEPSGLGAFRSCNLLLRYRDVFLVDDDVVTGVQVARSVSVMLPVLGLIIVGIAVMARFGRLNPGFMLILFVAGVMFSSVSFVSVAATNPQAVAGLVEQLQREQSGGGGGDGGASSDGGNGNESEVIGDAAGSLGALAGGASAEDVAADAATEAGEEAASDAVRHAVAELEPPNASMGTGGFMLSVGSLLILLVALLEPIAVVAIGFSPRMLLRALACYVGYAGLVVVVTTVGAAVLHSTLEALGLQIPMLGDILKSGI